MKKQKFTTILWDVDNTLLDFNYSMRHSLKTCFRSIGEKVTDEMIDRYSQINDDWWARLERSEVTKEQLLKGRFVDFFEEYGLKHIDVVPFQLEYQRNLGTIYSYVDDSLTICKALQTKYKQYVVTNGVSASQRSKLNLSGFGDVMKDLFISEEVGYNKPQKEFFEYCLSKIEEKEVERILIVGDSISSDIQGGNSVGIQTCWYNPGERVKPDNCKIDYEITDLHQVYDILEIFQ